MFEIFIQGPLPDINALQAELARVFPDLKRISFPGAAARDTAGIVFQEREACLDKTLVRTLEIITAVEKGPASKAGFDIHVRDLGCSEPPGWSNGFKEPFEPVPGLIIWPWEHLSGRAPDAKTILLDPEHSFGTGRHPSTRLCLQILEQMAAHPVSNLRLGSRDVLDVGCGTGLLAIAAVKMGASSALGVDIDPRSVRAARKNVFNNNLSQAIEIRQGSLEVVHGKYDLVLANLVASVLISVASDIPGCLSDKGLAVVSGFGQNQSAHIRRLFEREGLGIEQEFTLEGWSAFLMR